MTSGCEFEQEDLCCLERGACHFQEDIIEEGILQTFQRCSATEDDLYYDPDDCESYDLTPEMERDIERNIYINSAFWFDPDIAYPTTYLMHKYWGML